MPIVNDFNAGVQTTITAGTTFPVEYALLGSAAVGQLGPVAQPIFEADMAYQVVAAYYRPEILGSTTLQLVHAVASTPVGSAATSLLGSFFNLAGAAGVVQSRPIVNSSINQLAAGDTLGILPGTAGAASGTGVLNVVLQRL